MEQEQHRAVLRRTLRSLGMPDWVVAYYKNEGLDILLRAGLKDLASFQAPGASPEVVNRTLEKAGLLPILACNIEWALLRAAELQEQGVQEADMASYVGRSDLRPFAQTPSQDAHAGHARDQQRTCGGPSTSKGWWSAWLPSAPLLWNAQPPQQPLTQAPVPAICLSGKAATAANGPCDVATAVTAAAVLQAPPTASTAKRHAVLDDVAHSMPIVATPTPLTSQHLSTCRRRHVHRPALGQE
ncbi:hypothetical protein HYH02_007490 [Chlamydomonas schloesseri]|uniref:Uncharacterized protein n=1 Tax=Chlamydomonas schloesseri TaxID=2026947 RepID=A0A835WHD9_9CHLO|nr:hypothetical protein HYH02_007490 [Chlamydomonas schloesseri]|eukprot:KAG2447567.1 hypothetical protein HYH02_007490 [Chlamydomonas schloesseri]